MDETFAEPTAGDNEEGSDFAIELQAHIKRIDHIAIAVRDLQEAVSWYVNKLGFTLLEKRITRGESTAMLSAVVVAGDAVVVLIQGTTPESQVSRFIENFGPGVQHIAFETKNFDYAVARVLEAGGEAETSLIKGPGIRQCFLRRDPGSGVRVELIERLGGDFTDATVEQLFREFEARGLF